MTKYKNKYRIESARLSEWDYSNPWWYYITVNTKNHVEWFGKIVNEVMKFNELSFITKNAGPKFRYIFQMWNWIILLLCQITYME
ncbi:MAG: hypothetical protein NTX65_06430 [Ignavibacteriales bacterium]|nr:hypothetical protein [Ignavibacteriales bacterium]